MKLNLVTGKSIDLATPLVRDFATTINAIVTLDKNRDGRIDIGEGSTFAMQLLQAVLRNYSTISEALAQLKDANSAERKELVAVFSDGFDLNDNDLEQLIEGTISDLEDIATRIAGRIKQWSDKLRPVA